MSEIEEKVVLELAIRKYTEIQKLEKRLEQLKNELSVLVRLMPNDAFTKYIRITLEMDNEGDNDD